jgi:hypothetical protein
MRVNGTRAFERSSGWQPTTYSPTRSAALPSCVLSPCPTKSVIRHGEGGGLMDTTVIFRGYFAHIFDRYLACRIFFERNRRAHESRPALAFAPGRLDHHGALGRGQSRIPQLDRGDRHRNSSRTNDDADGRGICRIRKGHAQRADQGRVGGRSRGRRIGGHRPKPSPQQQAEIRKMISKGGKTAADAARLFKIHPATVSRLLAKASGSSSRKVAHAK